MINKNFKIISKIIIENNNRNTKIENSGFRVMIL
jgi:hypothetical protein